LHPRECIGLTNNVERCIFYVIILTYNKNDYLKYK
jgi:hypothetical protein